MAHPQLTSSHPQLELRYPQQADEQVKERRFHVDDNEQLLMMTMMSEGCVGRMEWDDG